MIFEVHVKQEKVHQWVSTVDSYGVLHIELEVGEVPNSATGTKHAIGPNKRRISS